MFFLRSKGLVEVIFEAYGEKGLGFKSGSHFIISEIGYLLLPSPNMTEIILKHSIILIVNPQRNIHVKLEKFKRGRTPSLHLAKEGDFARNHIVTLILSINIQIPAEILEMMKIRIA